MKLYRKPTSNFDGYYPFVNGNFVLISFLETHNKNDGTCDSCVKKIHQ